MLIASGILRTVFPLRAAATACERNVRYMFRARGITTKWRTLESGKREEGGNGGRVRKRERENGRATGVLRGNAARGRGGEVVSERTGREEGGGREG